MNILDEIELDMYVKDRLNRGKMYSKVVPKHIKPLLDESQREPDNKRIKEIMRLQKLKPHFVKLENLLPNDGIDDTAIWYGPDIPDIHKAKYR